MQKKKKGVFNLTIEISELCAEAAVFLFGFKTKREICEIREIREINFTGSPPEPGLPLSLHGIFSKMNFSSRR